MQRKPRPLQTPKNQMASFASARSAVRSAAFRSAAKRLAADAKATRRPSPGHARLPAAPRLLRSPVELSCCPETLVPMHSATASALMTSMLSISLHGYGRLSEAGKDDE